MAWLIYALKNPRTLEVRYVGFTTKSVDKRLKDHIRESLAGTPTRKCRWIMSLLSIGLLPLIEAIESGSGDGWEEAERHWIAVYRATGADLTNLTKGGDGVIGWGTPEQRSERAKKTQARLTPERRSAIAKKRWTRWTPEQRTAIAQKRIAVMTPEQRSAATKKGHEGKTPEQRSADVRKGWASKTPEQRGAAGTHFKGGSANRTRWASLTPEQRSAISQKGRAKTTHEQRSDRAKKANSNWTLAQRSAWADKLKQVQARLTPEQRTARSLKANAARTTEERSATAKRFWAAKRAAQAASEHSTESRVS